MAEVLRLRDQGIGARRIAGHTGVPVYTIRDWLAGKVPRHSRDLVDEGRVAAPCPSCGHAPHDLEGLPKLYVYLLGLYLGDGTISSHARGVGRLRITLDRKYPGIVRECVRAMQATMPRSRVGQVVRPTNCVDVSSYSKAWACLFPQHGPGPKHRRRIWLSSWQRRLAESHPKLLLRGMIHSDGSRTMNTRGSADNWAAPRYAFTNVSTDITSIFCTACDRLDLRWTASFPRDTRRTVSIYVSRKSDVARMDEFIGSKS